MNALAAIIPLLCVIVLTAMFRRPAFISAWCGVGLVILLMLVIPSFATALTQLSPGIGAAGLITLQAVMVIIPGLYLNELLATSKAHDRLVNWINQIPMKSTHKVIFIVMGLSPALDSLTGFGVPLLITIPLLMAIAPRRTALRQAMLGMNIMPWGTLGLAIVVGAQLSGQRTEALGLGTALISFGVFPTFGAAAALMVAKRGERLLAAAQGIALSLILSVCLIALNWAGVIELAGILAGSISAVSCLLLFNKERSAISPPWSAIAPYGMVLGLIFLIRILPLLGVPIHDWAIKAGGVSFTPLGSPGIALAVTALILRGGKLTGAALKGAAQRAYKPALALGGFTLMAQLMLASGMINAVRGALPTSNIYGLTAIAPLLGMASGYLAGSNVGANALMMTMQSSIGTGVGARLAFAAIQNSTAGHAVFASMPMILLILALSGGARQGEESEMVRFGLLMCGLVAAVTILASLVLAGC